MDRVKRCWHQHANPVKYFKKKRYKSFADDAICTHCKLYLKHSNKDIFRDVKRKKKLS